MTEDQSTARPRRRNTKERIIDEAEALAAIHGIEHLKLQEVADKIGIKLPSVYAHFSGREDILAAMGARINSAFSAFYVARPGETACNTLMRGVKELADFLVGNPAYFRLILRDLSVPLGYDATNRRYSMHASGQLPPEMTQLLGRLDALLHKASKEEHARQVSAMEFMSAVHGAALMRLSMETNTSPENLSPQPPSADTLTALLQTLASQLLNCPKN